MSMFPSLMRSFMNLLVRSNSISWHCSRSLKSGLSRKESLNSSVGRPIARLIHAANYERTTARRLLCPLSETPNGVSVCSEQISLKFPPAPLFHAFLTFLPSRTSGHKNTTESLIEKVWLSYTTSSMQLLSSLLIVATFI